ncbi:bifunctional hydroxymethylpyrimidine kinase/phosphomethylpyrimidine kinase [Terriglobus aquaticus]
MDGRPQRNLTALSIAGFDPGSGAGITADLLTFAQFGVFATSAITALTVQSTRGVRRVEPVSADLLHDTLQELEADLPADGIKVGMLGSAPQVEVVARFLQQVRSKRPITVVLDPVLVSSSGAILLDPAGLGAMQRELLPFVDAVTPNAPEAAVLTGMPCASELDAERCAAELCGRYPKLVPVVTGGHLEPPSDLVLWEGSPTWIAGRRLQSRSTHGTGCVFSSALLAAFLHKGDWLAAARQAKAFVTAAMQNATPRGSGCGPLNLLGKPKPISAS